MLGAEPVPTAVREGGWAVAQSPILGTTITLERLRIRGYVSMLGLYQKVSPIINSSFGGSLTT